jgi:hypothetical protein
MQEARYSYNLAAKPVTETENDCNARSLTAWRNPRHVVATIRKMQIRAICMQVPPSERAAWRPHMPR